MGLDSEVRNYFARRRDAGRFIFPMPQIPVDAGKIMVTIDMSIILFSKPAYILTDTLFVEYVARLIERYCASVVFLLWDIPELVTLAKVPIQRQRDKPPPAAGAAGAAGAGAGAPALFAKGGSEQMMPQKWHEYLSGLPRAARQALACDFEFALIQYLDAARARRENPSTIVFHPSLSFSQSLGGGIKRSFILGELPESITTALDDPKSMMGIGEADFRPAALVALFDAIEQCNWIIDSVDTDTLMILLRTALARSRCAPTTSIWWRPRPRAAPAASPVPPAGASTLAALSSAFGVVSPVDASAPATPATLATPAAAPAYEFWNIQELATRIAEERGADAEAWLRSFWAAAIFAGSDLVETLPGISAKNFIERTAQCGVSLLAPAGAGVGVGAPTLDYSVMWRIIREAYAKAQRRKPGDVPSFEELQRKMKKRVCIGDVILRMCQTEWALFYYWNGHNPSIVEQISPLTIDETTGDSLYGWQLQFPNWNGDPRSNIIVAKRVRSHTPSPAQ